MATWKRNVSISIDSELFEWLVDAAHEYRMSRSALMEHALQLFMESRQIDALEAEDLKQKKG